MCTYNITVSDSLVERVRPAFADNEAIGQWMRVQIEAMLQQMAAEMLHNETISAAEHAKRKAEDDFLARKMSEIKISPRIVRLMEETRLTPEEAKDERTRYILKRKITIH